MKQLVNKMMFCLFTFDFANVRILMEKDTYLFGQWKIKTIQSQSTSDKIEKERARAH